MATKSSIRNSRRFWNNRRSTRQRVPLRTLHASAAPINLRDKTEARRMRTLRQGWQLDAFAYSKSVPEISFANRFKANAAKRMRVFPAAVNPANPDGAPVSLQEAGFPQQVIESCEEAMEALGIGRIAKAPLMEGLCRGFTTPGECWLVGRTDPDSGVETWETRSISEVMIQDDVYKLRDVPLDPQGQLGWVELDPDDTYVARMWVPDAEFKALADSPMRALLDTCEELLLLQRDIRATARSRLAGAGFLKVPEGLRLQSFLEDDLDPEADEFLSRLQEAMLVPIADEGVASAVVPIGVTGSAEDLAAFQHLVIDRPYSALALELRTEAIGRVANGLDVPRAIVLGLEDVNHWGAWQISDDTFRHHIEPDTITQVDALTNAFLRPWLEDDQIDEYWVDRAVMWYDPVELVTHPDRTSDATVLHERLVISDAALRDIAGFDDSDAPSPQEIELRMVRNTKTFPPNVLEALFHVLDPNLQIPPIEGSGQIPGMGPRGAIAVEPPLPPTPALAPPAPALTPPASTDTLPDPTTPSPQDAGSTATAMDHSVTFAARGSAGATNVRLSRRLGQIDVELRSKIQVAANASMSKVLERAGAKLRSKINGNRKDPALRQAITTLANREIAPTLGETVVAAMGFANSQELLNADWSDLKTQFYAWTEAAQRQALAQAAQIAGVATTDESYQAAQVAMAQGTDKAWDFMTNALDALAEKVLYNPAPSAQDVASFDPNTVVPMGTVRTSASIAGGYDLPKETTDVTGRTMGTPLGSIGNGTTVSNFLTSNNMEVESYEWVHNYAGDHPLEGHLDLDGVSFSSFTDDVLANGGDFPDNEYYMPGDHDGCVCDFNTIWQAADGSGDDDGDDSDDDSDDSDDSDDDDDQGEGDDS